MAYDFANLAIFLDDLRVLDVLLPFLLIFTLVFAILQKSKILGADKKQFNVIIALVMALAVIIPHVTGSYPGGFDVVDVINSILPQIALVTVLILMVLIIIGIFAPAAATWAALVGVVIVVLIFLGTTNWIFGLDWLYDFLGEDIIALAVILIVFGLLIKYITGGESTTAAKAGDTVKDFFEKLFKG